MRRFAPLVAAAVTLVVAAAVVVWWGSRSPAVVPATHAADDACVRAAQSYPAALGRLPRTPLDVTAAAVYGEPAVVVRCGVEPLGPTTDECVTVSGVDWVVHPLSDGARLTTYGRSPALEVLVPAAHGPAPLLVPALGAAARALPVNGRHCIG